MLRGEFIGGNGLVLPNNITKFGAESLLSMALRDSGLTLWVGLVDAVADAELQIEDVEEPTLGVGGYARLPIDRSELGWPVAGLVNDEPFLESRMLTWAASGVDFDKPIRRMMIVTSSTALTGAVFALSTPLPAARTITTITAESLRQFKYRIYLR
jgi:hypothetical protein